MTPGPLQPDALLDRVAALREARDFAPHAAPEGNPIGPLAEGLRLLLEDRHFRPEHRERVYEDLVKNRALLIRAGDPRLLDLIYWSEQVERLQSALRRGRLSLFHFTRAMEATARRCGCQLLPAMGRLDHLAHAWSHRDFVATARVLLPHLVEIEAPGEAAPELRP